MVSRRQLEANRENAKRSTGPRSAVGRARSRMNSRKHGLTATTLVIGDEDPTQFELLRAEFLQEYTPQSAMECELVERLVGLAWRLRRVPAFEAALLGARCADAEGDAVLDLAGDSQDDYDKALSARTLGLALIQDGTGSDVLGKLARHEASLMNALTRTLQMLLLLQSRRANAEAGGLIVEGVALPPRGSSPKND